MSEESIMSLNDHALKIEPPDYLEEDIKREVEEFDVIDDIVKSESCSEAQDDDTCLERFMNSEVMIEEEVKQESIETSAYECNICNISFVESHHFKEHMVNHKPSHSEERPFKCKVCHKTFKLPKGLISHMITHSEERPFNCTICNQAFKQLVVLKKHMFIHSGERSHECSICNKTFTELGNLKSHMHIHSGDRPHACSICKKSFTQLSRLRSHMMMHSGVRPHECNTCNKTFTELSKFFKVTMASNKYLPETLEKALKEIRDGTLSVYKASRTYKIPNQTLYDKLHGKYKKQGRAGAPAVLTPEEENLIVEWVITMAQMGFPVTKDILLHSVHKLVAELGRSNKFKEGYPGRHWYEGFLRRNPVISKRLCQPLTTAHDCVSEVKIRAWFKQVQQYFQENDFSELLQDPSRIFNCGESTFSLCPKGQAVLTKTGSKSVHCKSDNNDKECLNVLIGASADGKLMPILSLFPYKRIPSNILAKYPKTWSIGKSDNGWMTSENFFEYIGNVFNPFLINENIEKPVVLFLDGHVSYLSYHLCKLCREIGIILVALLPNSPHILQPMDVAVFDSLKSAWSRNVYSWRIENNARRLKREDFGPIIKKSIDEAVTQETIRNGFRKCGLYPFDENAIDYSRLIKNTTPSSNSDLPTSSIGSLTPGPSTLQSSNNFVALFEAHLGMAKLNAFQNCCGEWNGDLEDTSLYNYWKSIRQIYSNPPNHIVPSLESSHLGDSTLSEITLDWPNENLTLDEIEEHSTLI